MNKLLTVSSVVLTIYSAKKLIEKMRLNKMKSKNRALKTICEDSLLRLFDRVQKTNNPELIKETTGLLKLYLEKS
ncbi:hypothetical protein ACWEWU_13955 [Staphylococcus xylosus]